MMHILAFASVPRPWWRTDERLASTAGRKVWTDCCSCKVPASETDCRIVASWEPPLGWPWDYQDGLEPDFPTAAYYEDRIETRCAEGFGCTVKPRKKAGRALREMWRWGC